MNPFFLGEDEPLGFWGFFPSYSSEAQSYFFFFFFFVLTVFLWCGLFTLKLTHIKFLPILLLKNLFDRVLCGLGWPQTLVRVKDDLNPLILLPLPHQCRGYKYTLHTCECGALPWIQGIVYARQTLYQLNHTSSSLSFQNKSPATPGFLSLSLFPFPCQILEGMTYKPSF